MSSSRKPPIWFYILLICLCICCLCTASIIFGRSGAQQALNNEARGEEISGATPRKLGLCPNYPSAWTKIQFTNGPYCIQPGSTATVDSKGNLTGAIVKPCTGTTKTMDGHQVCEILR